MVTVACFLPGRAKDLSATPHTSIYLLSIQHASA